MSRLQAFGIHLAISCVVFAALAYLIIWVWYPDFLFTSDGGMHGIRLIILVDLVLGPTLTLIVFKAGKPGLKSDLTLIGVFQAACLMAGIYVVYSERPIAVVYSDGYFTSMTRDAYLSHGLPVPDLSHIPGKIPKWVAVDLPDDPHAQSDIRLGAWRAGMPLRTQAELYVPFSTELVDLENDAYPLEEIKDRDRDANELEQWIADYGGELSDHAFFPMGTRYKYLFLGIDKPTGQVLGVLDIPAPPMRSDAAELEISQS